MFTITQRELLLFRQVASKTFGRLPRAGVTIEFHVSADGLQLKLTHAGITLRYQSREPQATEGEIGFDFQQLRPLEAKSDEEILFRQNGHSSSWTAYVSLMQLSNLLAQDVKADETPAPVQTATLDKAMLESLAACTSMVDLKSSRDAIRCVQLNGEKQTMAATDGRKALFVKSCDWPWPDARLIPATGWFAAAAVRKTARDVTVDDLGKSARFTAGPWSVELPFEKHTFPDVARVTPARWQADTIVRFTDEDRQILSDALRSTRRSRDPHNFAVTLHAATTCSVRFGSPSGENRQEVTLPRATRAGMPLVAALPRHALTNFIDLGFDELLATEHAACFWSYDSDRQFVLMPLGENFIVPGRNDHPESSTCAVA